ncbi:hypothetical protein HYN69_00385 [Gemmobacter aquarius]|uniref:HTH lysR-type domain-containing protein n=1 Tax=Paragemmobacter aquarius TaxID=2169400 RepID=A0A2S0UH75_9RHOB|nr:LysR family transcriptional regulator [Gemmobacter aquarius]AWB47169.1 hypothetical protein HYN69_00385 [Gemmobacter aquarius]
MRLEWLEDILAIAETGSFSGAAERRRLTQSAFSRRVQQIEGYIGVELFDRGHKPIRMRPTTLAQSEQIAQLTLGLRQLVVDLRRGERLSSNKVVVACQHSLTTVRLPQLLRDMPEQADDVYIRLRSANLDECTGLLLSRQADIAIVFRLPNEAGDFNDDFIEVIVIGSDRFLPVFNAPLALAGQGGLREIPAIAYPSEVFFGSVMERRILPHLDPAHVYVPKVETALTLAAVEMAAAGVGVAWVPASLARGHIEAGRLIDLSSALPACDLDISAMRLEGSASQAAEGFWERLLKA